MLYNTTSSLKRNAGAVAGSLESLHAVRAIPPAFPWLDALPPAAPMLTITGRTLTIVPADGEAVRWWHVRVRIASVWTTLVIFGDQRTITFVEGDPERIIVHAIDMAGNASTAHVWVSTPP